MKVGMFDSGIGGLTVLKKLLNSFSGNRYIYVADTLRAPFGTKPESTLVHIANDILSFLEVKNTDIVVAACNTMDSVIRKYHLKPNGKYIGIVDKVPKMVSGKKIAVLATEATVKSGIYEKVLKGKEVFQKSAQLLVSAVENEPGSPKILKAILNHYLTPIKRWKADEVILGCTHFPLLSNYLNRFLSGIRIIDPADGIVEELKKYHHNYVRKNFVEFYITGDVDDFERKVKRLGFHKLAVLSFNKLLFGEGIQVEKNRDNIRTFGSG